MERHIWEIWWHPLQFLDSQIDRKQRNDLRISLYPHRPLFRISNFLLRLAATGKDPAMCPTGGRLTMTWFVAICRNLNLSIIEEVIMTHKKCCWLPTMQYQGDLGHHVGVAPRQAYGPSPGVLSCYGWPPWPSLVVFCYLHQMVIITVIVVMLDDM